MKVDTTQIVKNLDGTELQERMGNDEDGKPILSFLTLKMIAVNALMSNNRDDKADGVEKAKRWNLACEIQKQDIVELKAEQITKIKTLIGQTYATAVVGPAFAMLEALESKPELVEDKPESA